MESRDPCCAIGRATSCPFRWLELNAKPCTAENNNERIPIRRKDLPLHRCCDIIDSIGGKGDFFRSAIIVIDIGMFLLELLDEPCEVARGSWRR